MVEQSGHGTVRGPCRWKGAARQRRCRITRSASPYQDLVPSPGSTSAELACSEASLAGLLDSTDQGEYFREPGLSDPQARASVTAGHCDANGPDPRRRARSLSRPREGSMLRQEVYADDAEYPGATPEPGPARPLSLQGHGAELRHSYLATA
jgi:hypothetical protein